eukprot:scaffold150643_cov18-Tisochrysis_lutea.AAC.3
MAFGPRATTYASLSWRANRNACRTPACAQVQVHQILTHAGYPPRGSHAAHGPSHNHAADCFWAAAAAAAGASGGSQHPWALGAAPTGIWPWKNAYHVLLLG